MNRSHCLQNWGTWMERQKQFSKCAFRYYVQ